eukprot:g41086.t1
MCLAVRASGQEASESRAVERFHGKTGRWDLMPDMAEKRDGCAAVAVDGRAIVLGGYSGGEVYLSSVEMFDPELSEWGQLAPMRRPRAFFSAVVMQGQIYALGGHANWVGEDSVERYDVGRNQWYMAAPMLTVRHSFAAAVLGGFLYVMGGTNDEFGDLDLVERYDERFDRWEEMEPMLMPRQGCSAAVLEGVIYVTGGMWYDEDRDAWNYLDSVERFDAYSNQWEEVAPMSYHRNFHATSVINGQLHVTGGWHDEEVLRSVERYDADNDEWQLVSHAPMNAERAGHAGVTIVPEAAGLRYYDVPLRNFLSSILIL